VQIHTRSANAKWLDEIAHTNPLWIHTSDARAMRVATGDLLRVETEIGHFVVRAWVTEGIRPGVVACSHHMGRWKLAGSLGQRAMTATVALEREPAPGTGDGNAAGGERDTNAARSAERGGLAERAAGGVNGGGSFGRETGDGGRAGSGEGAGDGARWTLRQTEGVRPFASADPDTLRLWWTEVGVHQNLTFPVHPDPISGAHCWHQAVRVKAAEPGDRAGDVSVDTEKAHRVYRDWLARTRPAERVSPDGTRRPYWLLRPLKPSREAYRL
jgi:hypothetical protein